MITVTIPSKTINKIQRDSFYESLRLCVLVCSHAVLIFLLCVGQQHSTDKLVEQSFSSQGLSDILTACVSLQTGPCVCQPRCRWKAQCKRQRGQQMAPIVPVICHRPMSTCFYVISIAGIQRNPPNGMSKASFGHSLSLAQFSRCKQPLSDGNVAG